MTLVKIHRHLSVNPEHVVSIRSNGMDETCYIEMTTGTRHEVAATVPFVMSLLNGVDSRRVTS